jgi:uncharacterized protein with von Willebrand factor type A (vWA) domain
VAPRGGPAPPRARATRLRRHPQRRPRRRALASLRLHHARRLIGNRTLVLLVTDGLDTGEPQALLQELDWLRRHSKRLVWLNPLLRFDGYAPLARGAAALHARAHGMLAVHNLEKLEDLAASLAKALAR